jgi:hypothetical protein
MSDAEAQQLREQLEATPVGFVELILGMEVSDKQAEALISLEFAQGPNGKITQIAMSTPNEGGKSSRVVAGAALYWAAIHKRGKVAITTKDSKQLNEQIIPAIEKHLPEFGEWHSVRSPYYRVTTPTGGTIIAYTTDDAGRVEGLHSDGPDAPLMWIVDEAKSVDEPIFQGIDRCGYRVKLLTSSPGLMQGAFFRAFNDNRDQYICVTAGLKDCPWIDRDKIKRIIDTYGEKHPFTRSSVYGEFMAEDDANQFAIPHTSLIRCLQNPPRHQPGMKVWFLDFGGGTAEHVIAGRDGNKIDIVDAWVEADKEAAANRFIRNFRKHGMKENQIFCDAADLEMWKLLQESGWTIHRQNFGAPARNTEEFVSWGASAWIECGFQIGKCELIIPPNDYKLHKQLTTRKKGIGRRGAQTVEEKYEMAKRNLPSPDRGDAYVGAAAVVDTTAIYDKQPFRIPSGIFTEQGYTDQFESGSILEEIGASAGL